MTLSQFIIVFIAFCTFAWLHPELATVLAAPVGVTDDLEMVGMNNRIRHRRRRAVRIPHGVYRPQRYLLTRNEAAFFRVLRALLWRRYLISCKVRLADVVTCFEPERQRGHANRIAQKHVDFVVSCADSSRILLVIELDDRSHERPERRRRDQFVNRLCSQLGVPLVRIPARWEYDRATIVDQLAGLGLDLEDRD